MLNRLRKRLARFLGLMTEDEMRQLIVFLVSEETRDLERLRRTIDQRVSEQLVNLRNMERRVQSVESEISKAASQTTLAIQDLILAVKLIEQEGELREQD